jgi:hypothetical protein
VIRGRGSACVGGIDSGHRVEQASHVFDVAPHWPRSVPLTVEWRHSGAAHQAHRCTRPSPAHRRLVLNVVVDVGHPDAYAVPRRILPDWARRLRGLPVLLVGVRCPIEVVMQRRRATWGAGRADDGSVPAPVSLWQQAVHVPGIYDLEVDTSMLGPQACAERCRGSAGGSREPVGTMSAGAPPSGGAGPQRGPA